MIIIVGMQINDNRSDELLQAAWPEASPSPCHALSAGTGQDRTVCYLAESDHVISSSLRRHTIHSLLGPQTRHARYKSPTTFQPYSLSPAKERGERGEGERGLGSRF